jgi:predicted peroxiredoxin
MKRLAIVVANGDPERLRTALVMAAAHNALGGESALFLQGAAVGLIRSPIADPDAERQSAAGLPMLSDLYNEALALGVTISACQSSLALLGATAADFDLHVTWGGMIGFLSTIEPPDRLLAI